MEQMPPSLLLSSLLILLLIPVTNSLDFNVDNSNFKTTMDFSPSAYANDDAIHLTAQSTDPDDDDDSVQTKVVGRATYKESVHLWDKKSNKLANFSTYFRFEIYSDTSKYGGGLAFFMAPVGSTIPSGSAGGGLGLMNSSKINKTDESSHGDDREASFFAVEFDTFLNEWEKSLPIPHVGVDLNSVISNKTTQWSNNVSVEVDNEAWIWYDSNTMTLSVNFTGNAGQEKVYHNRSYGNLSYVVDLQRYLPEHVVVGFSASVGNDSANQKVYNWSFNCTDLGGNKNGNLGLVLGLSLSLSSALVVASSLVYCKYVRKKTRQDASHEAPSEDDEDDLIDDPNMDNEFERGSGPKKFSYTELARATNDFSEKENLGEGAFGRVYRGFVQETNSYIAVKRLARRSRQGLKEYASEVKIISRLRHKNLVQFIGWCHQRGDLLLVYEYMPNGSLDYHLFGRNLIPLSWEVRYKIALGLALAVQYLHEECEQCVLHRDIKSSNVMLDSGFNAKLGDFGLARLVDHDKGSQTTVLAGTMGYMAPECVITGRASKESDVYSFGVVLLELACGRRPIDEGAEDRKMETRLIERVWNLYGSRRLLGGADPKLRSMFDEREMETLMVVGLWCVHPDSNYRPTIREANRVLNYEAPWPKLPYVVPQVMYYTPYHAASSSAGDDRTRIDHCSTSLTTSTAFSRICPR